MTKIDPSRFDPGVQESFETLNPALKPIAEAIREMVLAQSPEIKEELKWGMPNYTYDRLMAYIIFAKSRVSLGFHKGSKIASADDRGILEGAGTFMRHVKLTSLEKADWEYLAKLTRAAMQINRP
jgi:hypothetical protein